MSTLSDKGEMSKRSLPSKSHLNSRQGDPLPRGFERSEVVEGDSVRRGKGPLPGVDRS